MPSHVVVFFEHVKLDLVTISLRDLLLIEFMLAELATSALQMSFRGLLQTGFRGLFLFTLYNRFQGQSTQRAVMR